MAVVESAEREVVPELGVPLNHLLARCRCRAYSMVDRREELGE